MHGPTDDPNNAVPSRRSADHAVLVEPLDAPRTLAAHQRQIDAYRSFTRELGITQSLPPMGGWRILPDFAALLTEWLIRQRPRVILELGSGISTVICASVIRRQGVGRVYSVDHAEAFLADTRQLVADHGLSEQVEFITAPLRPIHVGTTGWTWYDPAALAAVPPIDCLVIDGPPQQANPTPLARYPALPILWDRLAVGALIILDDADRADEQTIMARWQADFSLMPQPAPPTEKGAAIFLAAPAEPPR